MTYRTNPIRKQPLLLQGLSGFFDEFFAAFGAADIDLATVLRYTHHLLALRTVEIAMLAVKQAVAQVQKPLIFTAALVNIA